MIGTDTLVFLHRPRRRLPPPAHRPRLCLLLASRRMDTHGFASLAHLQILLVPVGSISLSVFERYVAEIRSFESLRLGDIPVDSKNERGIRLRC